MTATPAQAPARLPVDVYIPVYNDIRFLPHAVASALSQTGVDVRVVVCDNASTDGTTHWLAERAAGEPRLTVHRNERNIGLLGNLNRYRDLVTAPYYMLLCSDDMLLTTTALARAAAVVAAHPDAVSVYCDLAYVDGGGLTIARRRFARSGAFSAEAALRASIASYRNMFGIPLLNRTDALRQLAYPDGLTYTGDVHLSMQASRHGSIHHIPDLLIANRYSGGNLTAAVFKESHAQFVQLERDFGIELTRAERARRAASYPVVMAGKMAFLAYMRWRGARQN